jgi:hypothetical protein
VSQDEIAKVLTTVCQELSEQRRKIRTLEETVKTLEAKQAESSNEETQQPIQSEQVVASSEVVNVVVIDSDGVMDALTNELNEHVNNPDIHTVSLDVLDMLVDENENPIESKESPEAVMAYSIIAPEWVEFVDRALIQSDGNIAYWNHVATALYRKEHEGIETQFSENEIKAVYDAALKLQVVSRKLNETAVKLMTDLWPDDIPTDARKKPNYETFIKLIMKRLEEIADSADVVCV